MLQLPTSQATLGIFLLSLRRLEQVTCSHKTEHAVTAKGKRHDLSSGELCWPTNFWAPHLCNPLSQRTLAERLPYEMMRSRQSAGNQGHTLRLKCAACCLCA